MSYRCKACGGIVPAGRPRLIHVVKREDGQIAREVPVCQKCSDLLASGASISDPRPTMEKAVPITKDAPAHVASEAKQLIPTTTER